MANLITGCRILCSMLLLFSRVFSPAFYALYLTAGLTDMLDGAVARKTQTVSEFGSQLDTVADGVFAIVCLIRLLSVLEVPAWVWVWTAVIALIKAVNILSGFVCWKQFVAEHTFMNKLTGLLLFCLPLTVPYIDFRYSAFAVCAIATFAAVQEGHFIRSGR